MGGGGGWEVSLREGGEEVLEWRQIHRRNSFQTQRWLIAHTATKKKKKDHALHNLKVLEEKTEAQTSKGDLNRTHSKLCATSQRLTHKHFFVQHPLRSLVSNLNKVTIQTITNM